jgi:[ribosomal protein S18]-alanine N-acetyltransferase
MGSNSDTSDFSRFQLKKMEIEHLPQVAEIHQAINPSPWSIEQWQVCYETPSYHNWVAVNAESVLAFASFMCVSTDAELLNIGVALNCQGKGLGQDLLQACLQLLPEDAEQCFLEVRRSNIPAINLYKKLNFELVAERKDYYRLSNGLIEDALVFRKTL